MKIDVIGGGPGGLYFAMLAAKRMPGSQITVHERNAIGATFGFGIALSDSTHAFLRADDEACFMDIERRGVPLKGQTITHAGRSTDFMSNDRGFGIERLALLEVLRSHALKAGVTFRPGEEITSLDMLQDSDAIVGADGVNSIVRRTFSDAFGTTSRMLTSRMAWYGTPRAFPMSRLTFKRTDHGWYWSVGYQHKPGFSTFVAECDGAAWDASGMAGMTPEEQCRHSEEIFSDELQGAPLLSNDTRWKQLPVTRVKQWSVGKHVLLGDALHSPHPSIGSGTRLSMSDASVLADCFSRFGNVAEAFSAYRAEREPSKRKLVNAMERSLEWYETVGSRLDGMSHAELVLDYMARTGRMDFARLRASAPAFCDENKALAETLFAGA